MDMNIRVQSMDLIVPRHLTTVRRIGACLGPRAAPLPPQMPPAFSHCLRGVPITSLRRGDENGDDAHAEKSRNGHTGI